MSEEKRKREKISPENQAYNAAISIRLAQARAAYNAQHTAQITQSALADAADITKAAISHYESGLRTIPAFVIHQYADILDIPVSALMNPDNRSEFYGTLQEEVCNLIKDLSDEDTTLIRDIALSLRKRKKR